MEGFAVTEQKFALAVDRKTKTLEEVVVAGRYNYANLDINSKRCPNVRAETIGGVTLFDFNEELTTDEYKARLASIRTDEAPNGYRSTDVIETATFGATHPDEQLNGPILGLDQEVRDSDGYVCVPVLDDWVGWRRLDLRLRGNRWVRCYRVLAVPASN